MTPQPLSNALLAARIAGYGARTALQDAAGEVSYAALHERSARVAQRLLAALSARDLAEARVPFLAGPGRDYVAALLGIWRAGGVAVPLCPLHPEPELRHVLTDSDPAALLADRAGAERLAGMAAELGAPLLEVSAASGGPAALPEVRAGRRAIIFYTSGTTGRPKGAVLTHAALAAQITSLTEGWAWTAEDRILSVLPLHHVHGVVNVLCCALWSGACCELHDRFDADAVWQRFVAPPQLTLFMAVPTIYAALATRWDAAPAAEREAMSAACRGLRLMVSGSAPLPATLCERWRALSGQPLLERYGMTELGMALSNPLAGPRVPGAVGHPLPGVRVRIVDELGGEASPGTPGELQVRGPGVMLEYWRREAETRAAFVDGWFRTGDVAVVEGGAYRLLGRSSSDIIKTGGYKVSALEIEEVLREHPAVREGAVIGLPDDRWGERVVAVVVLAEGVPLSLEVLRAFCRDRLAPYRIPRQLAIVDALPRNALGKVLKGELRRALGAAAVAGVSDTSP